MTATMETYALRTPAVDEAAARRTLRDQIARLEDELCGLVLSAWPDPLPVGTAAGASGRGAALQSLAQLEQARDALAARAAAARKVLDERGRVQEEARRTREEMLLEPERYRFARVTNAAAGERGCHDWHVRPRFGLLGMLAGWWRVVISSGCPLAGAPRRPRHVRNCRPRVQRTWSPSGTIHARHGSSRARAEYGSCSAARPSWTR
jgi:hypothetical protein